MTADYIYVNHKGIPCAPTARGLKGELIIPAPGEEKLWPGLIKEIKKECIPFREEDIKRAIRSCWNKCEIDGKLVDLVMTDTFYPVDPYEFEVEETHHYNISENGVPTGTLKLARII